MNGIVGMGHGPGRAIAAGLIVSAACFGFAGCGGGSGSSSLPHPAAAGTPSTPAIPSSRLTIAIKIPAPAALAALRRRPAYISPNTASAAIAINRQPPVVVDLTSGSPDCTSAPGGGRTCTTAVNAPVGADTFAETLYAGTGATGAVLSQARTSATIVAGAANVVTLALDGVIASLSLSLADPTPPTGAPATIGLTVNFNDASGAAIVGSDPFVTPVTLTDSDRSGITTLSMQTLASPADAASLTVGYTGGALGSAVFGASAGSVSATPVTLTPAVPPTPPPYGFNDYVTFGYDNARDAFNPNSTAITPASLGNIHLAWQANMQNYNTQTQPILATGVAGHSGMLFVGGGSGTVYAYDALTGANVWKHETGQVTYTCENNQTIYFGVGGTAAYDPGSKSIYIVGNANASLNAIASNTLYHLDAATGSVLGSVNIAPPVTGWNSLDFSHTSVTLGPNGIAYVGTGATCDKSSWRGRVTAVDVPAMTLHDTFFPVWDPQNARGAGAQPWGGGGVWGWGGVSLDSGGNVYTGIGNTDNGATTQGQIVAPFQASPAENSGYGEALLKLTADVTSVESAHHPIPSWKYSGDSGDLDLQGTPVLFTPNGTGCDTLAALQAKSGTIYLYDTQRIGNGPVAQYQLAPSTYSDGFLGGPAFSPATGLLYVGVSSSNESLFAPGMVAIDPGCGHPSIAWNAAFGPDSYAPGSDLTPGLPRSVPAVSAGGVVFIGTICTPAGNGCGATSSTSTNRRAAGSERKPLICCAPPGTGGGALWALDASTGTVLNGGNPLIITGGPLRVPPTIDGDWIFVLDNAGNFYGLTIDPNYAAIQATQRAPDSRMLKVWEGAPKHS